MQYTLINNGEESYLSVFVSGTNPVVVRSDHPNFRAIVEGVLADDESVLELLDIAATAAAKFEPLSERVSVANGRLYFDGDEVDNSLTTQVVRFLNEGVEDWRPLVNFFEKVQLNPQEHSRAQLFSWLEKRDFTITPDGDIVGYKGVRKGENDTFVSIQTGTATVNGVKESGHISNDIGDVVEMPRSSVAFDPSVGCSTGLHVGTYDYANRFSQGAVLEVHVNPRDVVSVPTDSEWAKVRCCRYKVVNTIDVPYDVPVLAGGYSDDQWYDDDYYEENEYDEDDGYYDNADIW